jgi:transcriptional regulator with XRE-family HTH domain
MFQSLVVRLSQEPVAQRTIASETMITRLTLALDQDLVRALERLAKAEKVSVSDFVARELKLAIRRSRSFSQARKRALRRLRQGIDLRWTPAPSRDELHRR